ncbi:hypothetical protein AM1_E0063 (plasmid) [Acaryochloris marina MBIC11017]|uniref:Uncharacterized protein n=1 Tax=Acaryochloris marina (strain MBIC 11017) TaxID=329726 RepID=A8ZP97_ACAM1|nr:hypothetical protein AM1_E0063 [Acaryochloris marina MBIC11017]
MSDFSDFKDLILISRKSQKSIPSDPSLGWRGISGNVTLLTAPRLQHAS